MTIGFLSFLLAQGISLMLDRAVRPRRGTWRSRQGTVLHVLATTALFGLCLAISGSAPVSGGLTVAVTALFVVVSNAKHAMLGEPLLFSDLALVAGIVRHPGFYLTALSIRQRGGLVAGTLCLLVGLAWFFVPHPAPHLAGVGLSLAATAGLSVLLNSGTWRALVRRPAVDADLARHGLIATILVYWARWRETPDPPRRIDRDREASATIDHAAPELVIVVQCESFADPADVAGDRGIVLPGLARARAHASQWGDLHVSGFGAYTMRTEFGVLFGRSEEALGFRRYDPFLTAHGEASHALPAKLGAAGYHCLFMHPHDLRFYGRDRLMPAIGFDRLLGERDFPPPGTGRHVDDRTVGRALCRLIDRADGLTFVYAVTMENHGPWDKDRTPGSPGGLDAYLHHLRSSDAMLGDLIDHLAGTRRSALLVFFGDHRPSIPGVTEPGPARHTPYAMLRFHDGKAIADPGNRIDLTPDRLHHAILRAARPGHTC